MNNNKDIVLRKRTHFIYYTTPEGIKIRNSVDNSYELTPLYKKPYDPKEVHSAYIDRLDQWNTELFRKVSLKVFGINNFYRAEGYTVGQIEKFLELYNGHRCELVEASVSTGYDGYDYTLLVWRNIDDDNN